MLIPRYRTELRAIVFAKLISFPLTFLLTAILFRALSIEDYALYSFFVASFYQFSQFDFGIFASLKTEVPRLLSSGEDNLSSYLFSTFIALVLIVLASFFALSSGYFFFYNQSHAMENFVHYFIFFGLLNNFFYFFLHTNAALGRSQYLTFNQILHTLLFLPFCLAAIFFDISDPRLFISAFVVSALFSNLIFTLVSLRNIQSYNFSVAGLQLSSIINTLIMGSPYFLNQLIAVCFVFGPKLAAFMLLNASDVAIQDLYSRLCSPFLALCVVISVPGWTRLAASFDNGSDDKDDIRRSQRAIVIFLIGCVVVISIVAPRIVELWVGQSAPPQDLITRIGFAVYFGATILYLNTAALANGLSELKLQALLGGGGVVLSLLLLVMLQATQRLDLTSLNVAASVGLLLFGFLGRMHIFRSH